MSSENKIAGSILVVAAVILVNTVVSEIRIRKLTKQNTAK